MKTLYYDAIIVGSGCAGFNCADTLYDYGYKNIAIVTEGINKGTSRNTGSDKQTYYKMSLSGDNGDSVYSMAKTLFDGGAMDGDVAICEAANSVKSFIKLANLGVNFPTNEFGEYVGYKTDHDPYMRATSIGPYTSKKMTEVLEHSVTKKGITVLNNCQAVKVIVDDGKVIGLICINIDNNCEFFAIKTPHVVLATGGPASLYYDSVYPLEHTGNSSLALDIGAVFVNLSEWQYGLASIDFRWNVSGTYQQVLPRYISVDEKGVEREFLLDYFDSPEEMLKNIFLKGYEWPFDVRKIYGSSYIDLIVYNESVVLGRKVYMDFTREPTGLEKGFSRLDKTVYDYLNNSDALISLPIERLRKMNSGAISLYKEHGIDIEKEPLRIAVCAQHNNGGIRVDSDYKTNVKGLYACGEVAGSLGIFRPGGSALNSSQVGSMRVARHIAYISDNKASNDFEKITNEEIKNLQKIIDQTKSNVSTYKTAREKYQKRMSKNFAFLRDIYSMQNAQKEIEKDLNIFTNENKWKKYDEVVEIFKNYDIIKMQYAVAEAMITTAKLYGSRGSCFVLNGGNFMQRQPIAENQEGRSKLVIQAFDGEKVKSEVRDVKPLPERNLWFEKVWNEYKTLIEKE